MSVDYLIIGQGISGTWLSYFLQKENQSFFVIDNNQPNAPSRLAAGIINPVTGRRHVEVWMADEIVPFSWQAYTSMGEELGIIAISQKDIIDFFPSPQMRLSFQQRVEENGDYVSLSTEENKYRDCFNYEFGFGEIKPVYTAHLENIIPAWRKQLTLTNQLKDENFDFAALKIADTFIEYKDIRAKKIIFCDGTSSVNNPLFTLLPFAPNKGEALIVNIPALPKTNIYKKGLPLVPLTAGDKWWIGSNYAWDFDNDSRTAEFREKTEALLQSWLTIPFSIHQHLCGIRPATLERRPFVGLHPVHPAVGILNGMGTKGCSLAPFFAKQLADHLVNGATIAPDADVDRFTRTLSRGH